MVKARAPPPNRESNREWAWGNMQAGDRVVAVDGCSTTPDGFRAWVGLLSHLIDGPFLSFQWVT